jgi:hypothetical protein
VNRVTAAGTGFSAWRLLPRRFHSMRETTMRGILLWLIGIPIPIIILLYLFGVV